MDLILEAIHRLKNDGLEFNFTMVIPTMPAGFHQLIRESIEEKSIYDIVEIKSDLDWEELLQNILNANAVVIPSYSEGFCFTAVETMALDIPIISSGKGALKEVVSGQYIEMKSQDAKGLTEALQEAMEGNWTITEQRRFRLSDSIEKYLSLIHI